MKEHGGQSALRRRKRLWAGQQHFRRSSLFFLRDCLLLGTGAFLLAGAQHNARAFPFAACLITALPFSLSTLAAVLGAIGGYYCFYAGIQAPEMLSLCLLLLVAIAIFQNTPLSAKVWFLPLITAIVCGILRAVVLLEERTFPWGDWVLYWASAGLFTQICRNALPGGRKGRLLLTAALIFALSSIPLPFHPGLLLAAGLSLALGRIEFSVMCGIALDLGSFGGTGYTLVFGFCGLLCQWLFRKKKIHAALCYFILGSTLLLICEASLAHFLSLTAGLLLGLLLGRLRFFTKECYSDALSSPQEKCTAAAELLLLLREQLPCESVSPGISETEGVFDGAAERICRRCPRFHRCWENRGAETYRALSKAAGRIMERGVARSEDFPSGFRNDCCQLEAFLTAVNQELEGMLFRRRYRTQLAESRQALVQQMECLERFLRTPDPASEDRTFGNYLPRVGICTMGKDGSTVNGDRGVSFPGHRGDYFVLLCDGVGSGKEASRMSGDTVLLLQQMLLTGLQPDSALLLLNGLEVLRSEDRFTTIDLLHLDLVSGQGVLYKWGAAPSYWKNGTEVKKIGTAAPPPGVGVGGEHAPERYALSLKEGEILVLTSDGAGGEETELTIGIYDGTSPQELAALLLAGLSPEDDMTAVAVSLRVYHSAGF